MTVRKQKTVAVDQSDLQAIRQELNDYFTPSVINGGRSQELPGSFIFRCFHALMLNSEEQVEFYCKDKGIPYAAFKQWRHHLMLGFPENVTGVLSLRQQQEQLRMVTGEYKGLNLLISSFKEQQAILDIALPILLERMGVRAAAEETTNVAAAENALRRDHDTPDSLVPYLAQALHQYARDQQQVAETKLNHQREAQANGKRIH